MGIEMGGFSWDVRGKMEYDEQIGFEMTGYFRECGWNLYRISGVEGGEIIKRGAAEIIKPNLKYISLPRCNDSRDGSLVSAVQDYVGGSPYFYFEDDVEIKALGVNGFILDESGVYKSEFSYSSIKLGSNIGVNFFGLMPQKDRVIFITSNTCPDLVIPYEAILLNENLSKREAPLMHIRDINKRLEEWEI